MTPVDQSGISDQSTAVDARAGMTFGEQVSRETSDASTGDTEPGDTGEPVAGGTGHELTCSCGKYALHDEADVVNVSDLEDPDKTECHASATCTASVDGVVTVIEPQAA